MFELGNIGPVLLFFLLQFILLFNAYQYAPVTYNDYIYPGWAEALGWLMTLASLIWIPVFACVTWIQHIGGVQYLTE